jgi:hypothetical protein
MELLVVVMARRFHTAWTQSGDLSVVWPLSKKAPDNAGAFSLIRMEIGSVFRANGPAITSCRALPHGPSLLLQSDAYYESRVL